MGMFARLIGVGAPAAEALLGEGRPVSAGDISGKKICWNKRQLDFIRGQWTVLKRYRSSWAVVGPQPGVIRIKNVYRQAEVLSHRSSPILIMLTSSKNIPIHVEPSV
jgi:hypothetical protein